MAQEQAQGSAQVTLEALSSRPYVLHSAGEPVTFKTHTFSPLALLQLHETGTHIPTLQVRKTEA